MRVAETAGYARGAKGDFYQAHNSPKHLWVRELEKRACQKLRSGTLPEAWAGVESLTAPRCRATPAQIMSLMELLGREVEEFRRDQALTYPVAGMLALIAIATFAGVVHGQRDLAAFGRTCSQAQLRALKFRMVPRSRRREAPGETTFMRVLAGVDAAQVERALLLWQDQVLGPAEDPLIAVDGKKLRHAGGVEVVSAFGVKSGRWMGSVCTAAKSNEPNEVRSPAEGSPQGRSEATANPGSPRTFGENRCEGENRRLRRAPHSARDSEGSRLRGGR